jgi:hypothetical protein
MLEPVDLSFRDEASEDPADLIEALPDVRRQVAAAPADDDLGLRTLLEHPEMFGHGWWRDQARRGRSSTRPRQHPAARRA